MWRRQESNLYDRSFKIYFTQIFTYLPILIGYRIYSWVTCLTVIYFLWLHPIYCQPIYKSITLASTNSATSPITFIYCLI